MASQAVPEKNKRWVPKACCGCKEQYDMTVVACDVCGFIATVTERRLLIARLSDVYLAYIIRLGRNATETRICMRFIQASALLQLQ